MTATPPPDPGSGGARLPALPPPANRWLTGLASAPLFEPAECVALAAAAQDGALVAQDAAAERLAGLLQQANAEYFRFDLSGAVADDEPVAVRLEPGGRLGALGVGIDADHTTRKLVALGVVALAADGPGELVVPLAGKQAALAVGTVHVWPAFYDAEVRLPAGGAGLAVVAHAFGPAFR